MRKNIMQGILFGLLLQLFSLVLLVSQAQAAQTTASISAFTEQYHSLDNSTYVGTEYNILGSNGAGISAYGTGSTYYGQSYSGSYAMRFKAIYSASLPPGVRVTSAYLNFCGYLDSENSSYYFTRVYANGNLINLSTSFGWQPGINVTNWFSGCSGGSITATNTFEFSQLYYTNPYGSGYYNYTESTTCYMYNSSYVPYITINYEYVPTPPGISSPVAGSNNYTAVTLSASSTVVGGGLITYYWQYSQDNVNWNSICSTTSTSYNWTIPTSIADNSSIYVRCYAVANGQTSDYSTVVRFNKATDPAIAAKLAAESAELAAEGAKLSADNANLTAQKTLSVVGKPCLEISSSNGATLTTGSTVALNFVYSNEMGNLTGMTFCYRNRSGTWSAWTALSNTGYCSVSIPLSTGYNLLEIKVKNAENVESKGAKFNIWRL